MNYPHITLLKSLCLLLILLLHALIPFTSPIPYWDVYAGTRAVGGDMVRNLLLVSLVPTFIFASGFLLEKSLQNAGGTCNEIFARRVRRLLVPWFLTMLFWLVPLYALFDIPAYGRPAGASFGATLLAGLEGRFADHLWFLLALFWASAFWLACRPLTLLAPENPLPARCALSCPCLETARHKLEALKPAWVPASWFHLQGKMPALTGPDLAGALLAFVAATTIQVAGQGLSWYSLAETAGPILFFYCGMLAYRHREWLDCFLWQNAAKVFCALALLVCILLPVVFSHFLLTWALSILSAVLLYQISLILVRLGLPAKKDTGAFAYFEKNAFRFYLFHMPVVILFFQAVNALDILSPWFCIIAVTALSLVTTAGIVWCMNKAEATQLPKLFKAMRPDV